MAPGIIAILLGLVALGLAAPVPILLARANWPTRAPGRALVLWQAIALAGGFSMIGALVAGGIALAPHDTLGGGILIGLAVGLTLHLLGHLAATVVSVGRSRSRHRALLDLLTSPDPARPQTVILDAPTPVAYCLPSGFSSITVLSRGLLDRLPPQELAAVIAHERAHLTQRHDIVLVAFRAWHSALPWFPIAARAAEEVAVLVELLADDGARRTTPDDVLARAIAAVASAPEGARVADPGIPREPPRTRDRVRRLVG
ncbi:M56 family metallopeptidase [Pseudolysinimonas sp.]|jgi:Zn-dependent protease with chaperone function|uniref:M56 family metallopeptidase n=1 Tax=Pseudolysinimonas sp. TaxID=2680009 RepID=UPI003784BCCE